MPLSKGEVVGLACIRELMETQTEDISVLRDQLYFDIADEDADDVAMTAFYLRVAVDYLDRIILRHDSPTSEKPYKKYSSCTDLALVTKKDEKLSEEKKLTEMTPNEIGEGTVLFDTRGDAWVVSLWTDKVMDLKQGNITKANVKPSTLEGWSFDGISFDDKIARMVEELAEGMDHPSAGAIAAEVVMREKSVKDPLHIIKEVNRVLTAA